VAGAFLALAVVAVWCSVSVTSDSGARAAFVPTEPPNTPMGVGQGIHPGRVAWVHEPEATCWDGSTGAWWDDDNTDAAMVDYMVSQSMRTLTGEPNDAAAWDALFTHFNETRGLGAVGYQPGEKVVIKINMNQDNSSSGRWGSAAGMPSPQVIHSMVHQLINVVGIPGEAITIYDASRRIGNPIYDKIHGDPDPEFQSIGFVCSTTAGGRIRAQYDAANPVRFGNANIARAYLPRCVTEAKYLINMALLRAHSLFGVTLCAKNHFGSTYFHGNGWTPSPLHNYGDRNNAMATYNCLVDLIGHAHLGGKTLLYMIDGLYSARNQSSEVIRYASFGDDWCSSLFVSQDPIAIDSVGLDFVRNEPRETDCRGQGVDNHLHEAALADNPPSGMFYDPEGDGIRLQSLGVHEHWNNSRDKQYSRNLGLDMGIELVTPSLTSEDGPVQNVTTGTRYDFVRNAVRDANDGDEIVVAPGTYEETVNFEDKNLTVRSENPNDPAVVAATIIDGRGEAVILAGGQGPECMLMGLTITGAARGIYCDDSAPTILNCRITGNDEAGVKMGDGCDPTIANCIIAGNGGPGIDMLAPRGGRFILYNTATIAHCTIVDNAAEGVAGDDPIIVNSILYGNGSGELAQVDARLPVVNYCNVQGGYVGTGNIDVDPGFVSPDDYHLLPTSACIDAGDPDFVLGVVATDIDGTPRVAGGRADIGCDEFVEEPLACITWLGHASVKMSCEGTVVYVDPRRISGSPQDATLVLVTHRHGDHYSPGDIAKVTGPDTQFIAPGDVVTLHGGGQAIAPAQTLEVAGVTVAGVAAYNTNKPNHPKDRNWVGFIVEIGGRRIYVAGDTDLTDEMKALRDIDVAFLPAGGTYTMNATEAAEATGYILPVLAIPYHWGDVVGTMADAERFVALAACNAKVMTTSETLCSDEWAQDFKPAPAPGR
jgi:L-ascorbate metabolism protein UlaG (beta-lactamase superfamily)/uncharacterized protein (DUF362 family)